MLPTLVVYRLFHLMMRKNAKRIDLLVLQNLLKKAPPEEAVLFFARLILFVFLDLFTSLKTRHIQLW